MSWLWGGGKKKKSPEEEYKLKLDQLEKLGHKDRKKNLTMLKLYNGDVNLVLKDYTIQAPPPKPAANSKPAEKEPPPSQPKSQPNPQPKVEPKVEPKKVESKPQPKPQPKVEPKAEPKPQPTVQPKVEPKTEAKPQPKATPKVEEKPKVQPSAPKVQAEIAKPIMKTEQPAPTKQSKPLTLKNNLKDLPSSDIRQLLLNIGEPTIGEIVFSNAIDGAEFYNYNKVNPLLKKFNLSFGDEESYTSLVNQVEISYQKHGAVDPYDNKKKQPQQQEEETKNYTKEEEKEANLSTETLKENIANLISSDVRLLILPYNVELAERLYAFSISGSDLCKYDYDGVVFASGMKNLSKKEWNHIVTELKLPQSEPFDAAKWKQLEKQQQDLIKTLKNIDNSIKEVRKQMNEPPAAKPKQSQPQKQQKPKQSTDINLTKMYKQQQKQLNKIIQLEKETDKFLPSNLQKLKQRQQAILTTLHDQAAILGVDTKTITAIHQSARQDAQNEFGIYLKSGNVVIPSSQSNANNLDINITPKELEQRQLQTLSKINQTRNKLEKLARSKGVSLADLCAITSKVDTTEQITQQQFNQLNDQINSIFKGLANIAIEAKSVAKQYGAKLDNEQEVNAHLANIYGTLEQQQNAQIARLQYLNDQARMINPKAVQVNEEILHIVHHAHRRTSSGPLTLAVPRSPGESPTPHDHFPDTLETKEQYEQHSEHPAALPKQHRSRSPSIVVTSPDETQREANQVRQRRKSLQVNTSVLSDVLKESDPNNTGYLKQKTFVNALKRISITVDLNQDEMKMILKDVMDEKKGINIDKLLGFVSDQHSTLKLDSCRQWNSFRMKVICAKVPKK